MGCTNNLLVALAERGTPFVLCAEKEAEGKSDKNYLNKRLKNFKKMIDYAELQSCYREYILKYFGEKIIRNYYEIGRASCRERV